MNILRTFDIETVVKRKNMKTSNKEKVGIHGAERYTVKIAIEKIKNDAMTNIILLRHMESLTIEQKLYIAYFWGTREGKPTILDLGQ
jgi:hypothetical protein